jgi:hypothetical protein
MTDWGDAILNEQARTRTMPLPPDPGGPPERAPAATEAERQVPRPQPPDQPLRTHDQGTRTIPPPGEGG